MSILRKLAYSPTNFPFLQDQCFHKSKSSRNKDVVCSVHFSSKFDGASANVTPKVQEKYKDIKK